MSRAREIAAILCLLTGPVIPILIVLGLTYCG
jgi:hypothetical protein